MRAVSAVPAAQGVPLDAAAPQEAAAPVVVPAAETVGAVAAALAAEAGSNQRVARVEAAEEEVRAVRMAACAGSGVHSEGAEGRWVAAVGRAACSAREANWAGCWVD